jgi:hypothetical protein
MVALSFGRNTEPPRRTRMPEATAVAAPPAAAPAAAPAAVSAPSAPATPVSTPVASPESPAAGAGSPPAGAPSPGDTLSAPAAAAPAAKGAEPKQEDFPGDIVSFLDAHNTWEREQTPGDQQPAADGEAQPETKPAEGETKPSEADTKPEEKAPATEPAETVTPEALNALMAKSPELQAAMDASPEVKNALFAMARLNAKAAPILEIFPNVESANYAADAANTVVTLRTGFLEAVDNPEQFPDAFEQFAEQFAITDKDGKPVVDAEGNPTYGEDFHMLGDFIVDSFHDTEIEGLEAQLQAGQFRTEDEREQADMALQALKFIKDWKKGQGVEKKPDLSSLSPEARAYYEQKDRELAEREAALGDKTKTQTAEQRKQERANYETAVQGKVGHSVGSRIQAMLTEKEKVGAFIPSYVLEAKDPGTGISVFTKTVLDQFEEATYGRVDRATGKVIGGVAYIRDQAKMLARRPPSPEAEAARVDFYNKLIDEHFPTIFDKEFRKVQSKEIADRQRNQGRSEIREKLAEREPKAAGSAGSPKSLTPQDAMKQAEEWVDANFPDLDRRERLAKTLMRKDEMLRS